MTILKDDLFNEILINPVNEGGNNLFIISGYATSAMAFHHLNLLKSQEKEININLIVGMCPTDGVSLSNHKGFQHLSNEEYPHNFTCNYITRSPSVHSKVYSWFKDDQPLTGFIGSANYTQNAFSTRQKESLGLCDPLYAKNYFDELESESIYCTHPDTENLVSIYNERVYARRRRIDVDITETEIGIDEPVQELDNITVSFLNRKGELPQRSGLNWGQRPEYRRNPNQAYIRLTSDIYNTIFFPPVKVQFTLLTDDSKTLICTRAQDNGKAIHTPQNNSLLGEYFRNRLGVPNGEPVLLEHLINYGRSDLTFYKVDSETYYLDFSV
jgi:HKD family nuclease|tara:strand:- start:1184 stop:2164 length:981 start_codon:yes stop_codon:yes gene_type:complete